MKYFEIIPDQEISNPIRIQKVDKNVYKNGISKEAFAEIPSLAVGYFENLPERELYDVLHEPAFLLSDRMKRLLALYEPEMEFKAIQLFATEERDHTAPLYWFPYIIPLDCLSAKTERYPNGVIKRMILDEKKAWNKSIFRVDGMMEQRIIVSLPVAESMLRRKVTGISFAPVIFLGGRHEESGISGFGADSH